MRLATTVGCLDSDVRAAAINVAFCDAHREFIGQGSDYAQVVLDEYALTERIAMAFQRRASGWDPNAAAFDKINVRKIRYEVAQLYSRDKNL